ncbi:MAG: hypothetical protein P9X24_18345 [Candidatus Hatepunaea meridiana]|nr:hypothetical protein [Candidatus Hatepunaea meridiana]
MIRKLILPAILLSSLLLSCIRADDETKLIMTMIETLIVPDSVYSPDMGIGCSESGLSCDEIINNYRRENGLGDFIFDERRRNAQLINSEYSDESNLIHLRVRHSRDSTIWQATDPDSNKWLIREIKLRKEDCPELGNQYRYYSDYYLSKNGNDISRFRAYSTLYPAYPIYQAYLNYGDWVICCQGDCFKLVINGVDLNKKNGYDNCISAAHFRGCLFYIFERDGECGWSFNGVEGSEQYELVYCHFSDGEGCAFGNPSGYRGFYALRDGMWYFVNGKVGIDRE